MLDLCKDSEEANTFIASEKYIDHYFDTKVKQILIISLKVLTTGKMVSFFTKESYSTQKNKQFCLLYFLKILP